VVKVVDFKPLAPHCCGFKTKRDFGFFHVRKLRIQLAYGTSVVLLRCPFVSEIMHGGASEVFLHQYTGTS
jgi:hypothetical protein